MLLRADAGSAMPSLLRIAPPASTTAMERNWPRLMPGNFRFLEATNSSCDLPGQVSRPKESSRTSPFFSRTMRGASPSSRLRLERSTSVSGTVSPRAATSLPERISTTAVPIHFW